MNEPRKYTSEDRRYSGPGRTGICVCGHPAEEHHGGFVMNQEYYEATGEAYVFGECEHYGCNELGGMMPDPKHPRSRKWVPHCGEYRDSGLNAEHGRKGAR